MSLCGYARFIEGMCWEVWLESTEVNGMRQELDGNQVSEAIP